VGTRTDPRFGLVTSINVKGSDVVKKPQATSVPTEPMVLSSVITIPFAGEWTIHVTETTPYAQEMMYSPYTVVVVPALTSPPMCQFNFPFAVKAGEIFEGGEMRGGTISWHCKHYNSVSSEPLVHVLACPPTHTFSLNPSPPISLRQL